MNATGIAEPAAGGSLRAAVDRCIAELEQARTHHRSVMAAAEAERAALVAQLADWERSAAVAGPSGARAMEMLRARLAAAEQRAYDAGAAAEDCERGLSGLCAAREQADEAVAAHSVNSRELFQIVEDERMRIARDMHDGPAQLLANLVLKAEIVERVFDLDRDTAMSELADFKATVRVALEETRRLIFDLRPMTLDDLGLVPTLRKFCVDFEQRSRMRARLNIVGAERRLPGDLEASLFRIVQEAMANAGRHSGGDTIDVTVMIGPQRVVASVRDNGKGFDVAAAQVRAERTRHLGLVSMRERAGLENGVLDITSVPGHGTQVRVSIDYQGGAE
ncbi:MAG TPA: sensor histidine kinase [Candidatus Dormibacteraeota bacterium]|nr:sensor histidine kinase [Candidatus Dormibacteraeota bacterium]